MNAPHFARFFNALFLCTFSSTPSISVSPDVTRQQVRRDFAAAKCVDIACTRTSKPNETVSALRAHHQSFFYTMRITDKLTLKDYFAHRRFRGRADNHAKDAHNTTRFALISNYFYYFGTRSVSIASIPRQYLNHQFEKRCQGFRKDFRDAFIADFVEWLRTNFRRGVHAQPHGGRPAHAPQIICTRMSPNHVTELTGSTRYRSCSPQTHCTEPQRAPATVQKLRAMSNLFLVAFDIIEESSALRKYLASIDAFELSVQTYLVQSDFHPMNLKQTLERFLRVSNPPRDGIFVVPLAPPRISMNFDRLSEWLTERRL